MPSIGVLKRFSAAPVLAAVIFISLSVTSCSKSTSVDDDDTDKTPPTVVTDLVVISFTSQTAVLRWTAPGDLRDDGSEGAVVAYDLRAYSDSITEQTFPAATAVPAPGVLPPGRVQQCTVEDLMPDGVYYFALKVEDRDNNWSGLSNCVAVHCTPLRVVHIEDSVLERTVRDRIAKPNGDILSTDVDTIWQVVVQNAGIKSLAGLECFASLQYLDVGGNEIVDLSPLGQLEHLINLLVSDNEINDITPLSDMVSLRQLHLNDNPISDISPLATTDSLQRLILWGTQVTDFSALYGLYGLSEVAFDRMNLTDIGFMSHLKRPQLCGLAFNQITSVEPLWNVYTLQTLNLMQNRLTDISALSSLINIRELRLTNNQIADIMPLVHNTGLDSGDVVYLDGNPLSQYSIEVLIPTLRFRGVTVHE